MRLRLHDFLFGDDLDRAFDLSACQLQRMLLSMESIRPASCWCVSQSGPGGVVRSVSVRSREMYELRDGFVYVYATVEGQDDELFKYSEKICQATVDVNKWFGDVNGGLLSHQ